MTENKLTGRVVSLEEITGNYPKTIVYLEAQYGDPIPVNFGGKNKDLAKDIKVGNEVTINFNVYARYWEKGGKTFTNIEGWKVVFTAGDSPRPEAQVEEPIVPQTDDLPF